MDKDFEDGYRVRAGLVEGVMESVDIRKSRIRLAIGNLHLLPNTLLETE